MALKHNKKKNAGIVYEQMISVVTRLAASKKYDEAKFVMEVIKKHFNPKSELGKEKKLIESLVRINGLSEKKAEKMFEETIAQACKLNEEKLEKEKQRLITDINKYLSKNLYDIQIPEYKAYASAQILFVESRNNYKHTSPAERVQIRETLLEGMTYSQPEKEEEKIDNLTYKLAVKKFNEKFGKMLSEDQKDILKGYLNFGLNNNKDKFKKLLESKLNKVRLQLAVHEEKDNHRSSDYSGLLTEARSEVEKLKITEINDEAVYKMMRYFDVVEDLNAVLKEDLQQ